MNLKDSAYIYFRLCGDHEKWIGKTGRYDGVCRNVFINEASRLITLVEDIIKLSKLDEGNVELEKEEVDLYKLTREILTRLSPQAAKRKVHVEVTGEPVEYVGIRQILDEMIYNICENAIKYNKEGGKLTVWVGNTLQGKKICVTDTGIGIPENETDRIFERFYRVDKSHSKETAEPALDCQS